MSYRCEICQAVVPAGTQLRRHTVYRRNGKIEREYPACAACLNAIGSGIPLSDLIYLHARSLPAVLLENRPVHAGRSILRRGGDHGPMG